MKFYWVFSFCIILMRFNIEAQAGPENPILNKFSLPGEGGWDYLTMDESSGRLFVSHGTIVQVLDVSNGNVLGTIPDIKGSHGIALAIEFNKGFITNGKDSSVTVFDLTSYATLDKIKVTGGFPDAILFDLPSKKIFTFNGKSSNSTVIDAENNQVSATISLDGKPEFALSDGKGKIFVNIEDKSEISEINTSTLKVENTWSIQPGEEPSGLAYDEINHRLFSVCENQLMVVLDSRNGKLITSLPIGEGVDGVAFDPDWKRIYSSNGEGTITVVEEKNNNLFQVIDTLITQKGARTITINKTSHHLYLSAGEYGETPEKTEANPHPRPVIKPGSFVVLDVFPVNIKGQ